MKLSPRRLLLAAALTSLAITTHAEAPADPINADSFGCIRDMTPVRGFFVDNLKGDLEATLAVANNADGGVYPPGSVVQLIPTEVMVKRDPGFSPATKDWEFIELDVSAEGASIRARGFADVNNKFGLNCFACHVKAEPQRDMICEQGHGCDPIPLTAAMSRALQKTDPRCAPTELSNEEIEGLKALRAVFGG
ncbi:MAG: hypothetical protein WAV92_09225 [Halopseudomonas yangmingensis]|uniref:Cytochrome c domain-containing protein n=1 Tax=Halopseudomonas yangmingensis TaxID=1720063 RepID=A0A1I4QWQ5_9GAMM|nr:hypothetical protein [Halopseudomonas yangmingensis]SFM44498.1 hypothetical protein SAMN05216217_10586 [Halopseudomonas yangmingensis]